MKEIYDWVPWFGELAQKIADNGEQYLIEKSKEVKWRKDGKKEMLLQYGNDNIDPFSFFYTLAKKNSKNFQEFVYLSVHDVFELTETLPSDPVNGFTFPTPPPNAKILFHEKGTGKPELLWKMFKDALEGLDKIDSGQFGQVLEIGNVAVRKLTQTLFLINPYKFLPFDGTNKDLALIDSSQKSTRLNQYKLYIDSTTKKFPGCDLYEVNMFNYLCTDYLDIKPNIYCFLVNMDVGVDRNDLWEELKTKNHVFISNPSDDVRSSLAEPERGDIILVRSGRDTGLGIGIVYLNDYRGEFNEAHRLHVIWLNKKSASIPGLTAMSDFCLATEHDINLFRKASEYAPTFELINERAKFSIEDKVLNNSFDCDAEHKPVKHNQILFGPPGTGKTYKTKELSLKILEKYQGDSSIDDKTFKELRYNPKTGSGQIAMITFHQNYAYEDFIEGIKPVTKGGQLTYELRPGIFKNIAGTARENSDKPYVLIIDEINRGNIPKIFGELITLIEDSRRQGEKDETKVTLPYSGDDFGVPNNLYLIGTMNTADHSTQLLDAALRRRFTFKEMMPVYEDLPDIEGIKLSELLKTINERITALIDRERQIGHTYLLKVETIEGLAETFQNKIFPLLQEYFFNDWKKIVSVLENNSFVKDQVIKNPDEDSYDEQDVKIYSVLDKDSEAWRDPTEYQKIYQHNNSGDSE